MLIKLLRTGDNKSLAIVRVLLGILLVIQGSRGMLGWFGPSNPTTTLEVLLRLISLPPSLLWLGVVTDFFAGSGLVFGLFTRVDALIVVVNTTVAVILHSLNIGLFEDWSRTQGSSGINYFLLGLFVALILFIRGGGAFSLDRMLLCRKLPSKSQLFSNSRPDYVPAGQEGASENELEVHGRRSLITGCNVNKSSSTTNL